MGKRIERRAGLHVIAKTPRKTAFTDTKGGSVAPHQQCHTPQLRTLRWRAQSCFVRPYEIDDRIDAALERKKLCSRNRVPNRRHTDQSREKKKQAQSSD